MKASLSNVSRVVKNKADSVTKWSGDITDSFRSKDKVSVFRRLNYTIVKNHSMDEIL